MYQDHAHPIVFKGLDSTPEAHPAPPTIDAGDGTPDLIASMIDADMRELADTVPHQIWLSAPKGSVQFFNARFYEYTGLPLGELHRVTWSSVVHPNDLDQCTHARTEAIRDKVTWRFEYRIRRHDGEYRWHVGRTVPLFDDAGNLRRWVGTATDIHEEVMAAHRHRRFVREVLMSVTEGRLRLCDHQGELPPSVAQTPVGGEAVALTTATLGAFRQVVREACEIGGLPLDRAGELLIAAGEAAMNAVVHGGDAAQGYVYAVHGCVQVWVSDAGRGIADDMLHRATLEQGFSSGGTLGHGFPMMLKTADRVFLLTGSQGTRVVLEMASTPPDVW